MKMKFAIGDRIITKSGDRGTIVPAPDWGMPYHAFVRLDRAPAPNPRWILWEAIEALERSTSDAA